MNDVNDGRDYSPRGRGKIKTGPRALDNSMRLKQKSGHMEGGHKKCDCGAVYEGGACPMC